MSRRALTLTVTALGVVLLAWQIEKTGLHEIADGVARMGWPGIALILAISLGRQIVRSIAWMLLLRGQPGTPAAPLTRALAAVLAGDAVGNLTPFSVVVSEPAKAMMLGSDVPPAQALAALAAENFFYSLSVALAVLSGVAVLFLAFPVPDWMAQASLIIVITMAAVLVAALALIWKEPALVSATLTKLGGTRAARIAAKVRDLETSAYAFVRASPGRLTGVACCEVAFHALSIGETWVTLWFLGQHSFALAFVLDTVQRVINVIFRVVPLKIGVDEVGSGLVSSALGYGSALGVTMALIRKIRVLAWSIVGLVLLGRRK